MADNGSKSNSTVQNDQETLNLFLEKWIKEDSPTPEQINFFRSKLDLFLQVHQLVNAPHTRAKNARKKNNLVFKLVKERLKNRNVESGLADLKKMVRTHRETGVKTHNCVLTLGDPSTGPSFVMMVHHDVVKADDYSLSIDCSGRLQGVGIQDDSIHLAAAIHAVSTVDIPDKGAVMFVFTDHEENGCRGSAAIKDEILAELNSDYPVSFIALESSDGKLGIGHRGKFSGELAADLSKKEPIAVTAAAGNLFQTLLLIQREMYEQSAVYDKSDKPSLLGRTTGSLTYGYVNNKEIFSTIDVRTSDTYPPSLVEQLFRLAFKRNLHLGIDEMLNWSTEAWKTGIYSISSGPGNITLRSKSKLTHPSVFNPAKDETIFPALYLVLRMLEAGGLASNVKNVTWGDSNKRNSLPVAASINADFEFDEEELFEMVDNFADAGAVSDSRPAGLNLSDTAFLSLNDQAIIKTEAVLTRETDLIDFLCTSLGIEETVVSFMTDAGLISDQAKRQSFNRVLVFIYGFGDPRRLHGLESLSSEEIIEVFWQVSFLLNQLQLGVRQLYVES